MAEIQSGTRIQSLGKKILAVSVSSRATIRSASAAIPSKTPASFHTGTTPAGSGAGRSRRKWYGKFDAQVGSPATIMRAGPAAVTPESFDIRTRQLRAAKASEKTGSATGS